MKIVLLLLGGGTGAICRYLLTEFITVRSVNRSFPIAILIVNLVGSFGLGILLGVVGANTNSAVSLMIGVGFFGVFTTFSSFSMEVLELIKARKWRNALLYVTITILGSICLCFFGISIIK
ncbi:MAG TPA: fluoride efflux transporter CrcB [Bacilli bacterium]|nr:fluoride efflux transporter CrcB [Bacilli bacterium]